MQKVRKAMKCLYWIIKLDYKVAEMVKLINLIGDKNPADWNPYVD